jgi:ATP-dependent Lon protease
MSEFSNGNPETVTRPADSLPADAIPLLAARNTVLFPGAIVPLAVGRERSVAAAQYAALHKRPLGVLLQRDAATEEPGPAELHSVGTLGTVTRYVTTQDGQHHAIVRGEQRFRIVEFVEGHGFLAARVRPIVESAASSAEIDGRFHQLKARALEALRLMPAVPAELAAGLEQVDSPTALADLVTSVLDLKPADKQQVLETEELRARLDKVLWFLAYQLQVLRVSREIGEQTRETMESRQREFVLREQMKAIQKELGEEDAGDGEVARLKARIAEANMPEAVARFAEKELARLARMPDAAGEASMLRTYLELLVELPWAVEAPKPIDLDESARILDEDHYGLDRIKKRILEYLAVRKLKPDGKAPILLFVGPPGVGKTSLGKSIARAMGRKFERVSLGGVHDEAEIRGHRRTYIGALPGLVIQAIRKAGARDGVLMLDEIDKLGRSFQGDPSAALLEVLDPEQNNSFRDNYLGPEALFDLSRVVFIANANTLDTIPAPLLNRMEVIRLSGYTETEKLRIAERYLVPRQREENGIAAGQAELTAESLRAILRDYTREAGVRELERAIGTVFRGVAMRVAREPDARVHVEPSDLPAILGPRRYEAEQASRVSVPGVVTGLAWTPVGGDILFVEAARVPGKGRLILTGQLGEVMKESAQAALSLVKSRAAALGIDPKLLEDSDIHVHVPAGAIPKDGPSAGVAMFTVLASLLTGRKARAEVAMTGEISLRGLVLPVGGIKEKVLAAMQAGIKTVMLPARNRKDFEDIPEEARKTLEFVWLETVDDALGTGLLPPEALAEAA